MLKQVSNKLLIATVLLGVVHIIYFILQTIILLIESYSYGYSYNFISLDWLLYLVLAIIPLIFNVFGLLSKSYIFTLIGGLIFLFTSLAFPFEFRLVFILAILYLVSTFKLKAQSPH